MLAYPEHIQTQLVGQLDLLDQIVQALLGATCRTIGNLGEAIDTKLDGCFLSFR